MAILTPPVTTEHVLGPFNTIGDYDLTMAWLDAASPANLLTRGITGYVGDPNAKTITIAAPTRTAGFNTAVPL